jgi:hypothetical protein
VRVGVPSVRPTNVSRVRARTTTDAWRSRAILFLSHLRRKSAAASAAGTLDQESKGVGFKSFTADGPISYWNNHVGVGQMGGQGNFSDPRIGLFITQAPDLVTPKLAALLDYQKPDLVRIPEVALSRFSEPPVGRNALMGRVLVPLGVHIGKAPHRPVLFWTALMLSSSLRSAPPGRSVNAP